MRALLSFIVIIPFVTLVSLLFWLLTLFGGYFYNKEDSAAKTENFECGFENTTLGEGQIDFKNSIVFAFLILYDVELLLLLPTSFNIFLTKQLGIYSLILVLTVITITCVLDAETGTLEYDN